MARVITVGSQKGGVGKSTTVLNLGYSLSRLGQRVLLVDADPQGGMSIASNLSRRTVSGLVPILRGQADPLTALTFSRDRTLAGLNTGVADLEDAFFLENACRNDGLARVFRAWDTSFDYVLIDAPAGVGSIVHGLLAASHGAILVVRCQTILVKSLPVFLKAVQYARQASNPQLRLVGALMTMRDPKDVLDEQVARELQESLPASVLFRVQIPLDVAYEIASQRTVPVARLRNAPEGGARAAAQAYMDLAIEFREREAASHPGDASNEDTEGLF
jgi:chromosome partitioning protein